MASEAEIFEKHWIRFMIGMMVFVSLVAIAGIVGLAVKNPIPIAILAVAAVVSYLLGTVFMRVMVE